MLGQIFWPIMGLLKAYLLRLLTPAMGRPNRRSYLHVPDLTDEIIS